MRTLTLWRAYKRLYGFLEENPYAKHDEDEQLIRRSRRQFKKLDAEITRRLEAETQE